jgi:hypothetical protein
MAEEFQTLVRSGAYAAWVAASRMLLSGVTVREGG